jgi:hypothetical protein
LHEPRRQVTQHNDFAGSGNRCTKADLYRIHQLHPHIFPKGIVRGNPGLDYTVAFTV